MISMVVMYLTKRPSHEVDNDEDILPGVDYIDIDTGQTSWEMEFDQEYFVFCWADFMSTLRLRLKFQYGYLRTRTRWRVLCMWS